MGFVNNYAAGRSGDALLERSSRSGFPSAGVPSIDRLSAGVSIKEIVESGILDDGKYEGDSSVRATSSAGYLGRGGIRYDEIQASGEGMYARHKSGGGSYQIGGGPPAVGGFGGGKDVAI